MLFTFSRRATWSFLSLLVLMHFVLFVDRVNLAAAAPVIQKDLGLSNIALGIAFSAFNYSYAPFQLVGGWFADRFGARRTLTVCGLWWSFTTIATSAVTGLVSLFAVRCVLGMGEGATLPAANCALSKWTPIASRGTAIGITHSAGRVRSSSSAPCRFFGRPCGGGSFTRIRAGIPASPAQNWPLCRPPIPPPSRVPARCRGGA
jgi:MFS family permease